MNCRRRADAICRIQALIQFVAGACLSIVVLSQPATGQENAAADDAKERDAVYEFCLKSAREYEVRVSQERVLKLRPESVLSWTNPVRRSKHGHVFVWHDDQRPLAIACIYLDTLRGWRHEFQSLTPDPIAARRSTQAVWLTQEPGLQWKPLDVEEAPADTEARRLIQMRAIARRFDARIGTTQIEALRLMAQPLYRYAKGQPEILDGAIFSFAQGTNPEILLLLEVATTNGKSSWRHALARMTGSQGEVRYNKNVIWRMESGGVGQPNRAYYNHYVGPVPGSPD